MKNEIWIKISRSLTLGRLFVLVNLTLAMAPFVQATTFTYLDPLPSNNALTQGSYLDVSKAPYSVNKTGGGNATTNSDKIQDAIDDAYADNLAVFFPAGTYLVNRQFELYQVKGEMTEAHVLIGSGSGTRPVIKLVNGSNGFGNTASPKPLFNYYCSHNGTINSGEQPASAYNMLFRGIDIDLGNNAGAIGVRMHAAQGSTIQDVKVTATNGFAGIEGLSGSGTTYANIEVQGGKHAFYLNKRSSPYNGVNRPMPTLTGITCIGQTSKPIHFKNNLMGPLTIVGFYIESGMTSDIVELDANDDNEHLCLIDGSIVMTHTSPVDVIYNVNRSLYLRNVHVKNGKNVVLNSQGPDIFTDVEDKWTHIGDYCFYKDANHSTDPRKFINGNDDDKEWGTSSITKDFTDPPSDLVSRHLWDESTFPHPESTAVVLGPTGSNDTEAINNAIASAETAGHNTVFLKRGDYYIDASIHLRKDTKLIGVARSLTRIHCVGGDNTNINSGWTEKNNSNYVPMVTTPNDTEATCTLAWLALVAPKNQGKKIYFTNWTAGRHSMVREVHFRQAGYWNGTANDMKRIKISGTGGGRWYSVFTRNADEQGENPNFRQVYVTGTTEPLSFYALTVEYSEPETYMMEFNNAQHIYVYGLKIETDIKNDEADDTSFKKTPGLGIVSSTDVIIMGQGGHADLDNNESNHALIEIDGTTDDIQIANASGGWDDQDGWGIVKDMRSGGITVLKNGGANGGEPCAMFLLGTPDVIAYTPPSGGSGGGGGGDLEGLNTMEVAGGIFAEHVASGADVTAGASADDWDFELASGNEYYIKKSGSSVYMEFNGGNYSACTLESGPGGNSQKWIVTDRGDGTFNLESKAHPGFYLFKSGADKATGCNSAGCETWANGKWIIIASNPPPAGPLSGLNTLEVAGSVFAEHASASADVTAGGSADNWDFEYLGSDEYSIRKDGSSLYMEFNGGNYVACTLESGTGSDNQIWIVTDRGDGTCNLESKAHPGYYLFKSGANKTAGCNAVGCETWTNGKWIITSGGAFSGLYTFNTKGSGNYAKNNGAVGADIPAGTSASNNVWELVLVSGDDYRIRVSGTATYIEYGGSGTNCTLQSGTGGNNRVWTITESAETGYFNIINKEHGDGLFSNSAFVRGNADPAAINWDNGKWTITAE